MHWPQACDATVDDGPPSGSPSPVQPSIHATPQDIHAQPSKRQPASMPPSGYPCPAQKMKTPTWGRVLGCASPTVVRCASTLWRHSNDNSGWSL
eukprot:1160690-Pelagomonas_calceolata.AAC.3